MCLSRDPSKRPTARELLLHPVLFEVHSLKLLAAHVIANCKLIRHKIYVCLSSIAKICSFVVTANRDTIEFNQLKTEIDPERVVAEIIHPDGRPPLQLK